MCFWTPADSTRDPTIRSEAHSVSAIRNARELAIGLAEALPCARRRERALDRRRNSGGEGPGHQGRRQFHRVPPALSAYGGAAGNFRRVLRSHADLHQAYLTDGPQYRRADARGP